MLGNSERGAVDLAHSGADLNPHPITQQNAHADRRWTTGLEQRRTARTRAAGALVTIVARLTIVQSPSDPGRSQPDPSFSRDHFPAEVAVRCSRVSNRIGDFGGAPPSRADWYSSQSQTGPAFIRCVAADADVAAPLFRFLERNLALERPRYRKALSAPRSRSGLARRRGA